MAGKHETIHDAGERIGRLLERVLPVDSAERGEAIAFVRAAVTELKTLDERFGTNTVWTWPFPERFQDSSRIRCVPCRSSSNTDRSIARQNESRLRLKSSQGRLRV